MTTTEQIDDIDTKWMKFRVRLKDYQSAFVERVSGGILSSGEVAEELEREIETAMGLEPEEFPFPVDKPGTYRIKCPPEFGPPAQWEVYRIEKAPSDDAGRFEQIGRRGDERIEAAGERAVKLGKRIADFGEGVARLAEWAVREVT